MSICVNKSHPEFRALVEQSGESTEFVAIKVADYFNTTGETDSMPTLEDLGLSKINEIAIPGQLVEERPQGISTKQGVPELFESNPELSSIGTQQQYSQYLDSIFPDSQVKDIVYHGTNLNFDKFDKTKIGGNTAVKGEKPSFSFSNNKQQAEAYSSEITVGQNTNELAEVWFEENQHVFKNGNISTGIIDINNVFDHYKKELEDSKEMISLTGEIDPVTGKYKLIPVNDKNLKELSEIKTKEWQQEYNTLLTAGARIMSVILNIKNPKIVDFKGEKKSVKFKEEQLSTKGDAFIAKNIDDWGKGDVIQVFEPEQIHILGSKQDIEGFKKFVKKNLNYQLPSNEGLIASEKTIRDLAARIADRIGIPVRFESDRTKEYKGKIENNVAYVNLAYATLDTPIHEILGHPIIRAIKNKNVNTKLQIYEGSTFIQVREIDGKNWKSLGTFKTKEDAQTFIKNNSQSQLYQSLLKELEYGKGKEVLDRIKRDYTVKNTPEIIEIEPINTDLGWGKEYEILGKTFDTKQKAVEYQKEKTEYYTLEEQQEEAIVELLGMMTAEKLDAVKDGKLISLLKRLLKEIKSFVKQLLGQKEVEIDKLPDNMTIGDIADLLAYSNSKLILPGYEVEYTTPDNMKFKTYQEASNHIRELAKSVEDVNLNMVNIQQVQKVIDPTNNKEIKRIYSEWISEPGFNAQVYTIEYIDGTTESKVDETLTKEQIKLYNDIQFNTISPLKDFIEKNKEYEQSKEIIEEWKKVNNIQYNPEEIYSRGQEFVSVVGAYSDFDVNLMMQNLLSHIEDNEKAGGKFAISAYTKPIDKQIGHLEGGGGKIKFKLYPQSNDILWAANTDVYSGSVWDASEKVNKDKKSELLGVSYTKYPSLRNVNTVQPNLAAIVDNLEHHHNELGIVLTGNNFRLEYDEDIPYQTKKIIDGINKILDQKYGKLVKPEINVKNREGFKVYFTDAYGNSAFSAPNFNTREEAQAFIDEKKDIDISFKIVPNTGIQPTQTKENTTSIESVKNRVLNIFSNEKYVHPELGYMDGYNNFESEPFKIDTDTFKLLYNVDKKTYNVVKQFPNYWQAVTKSNLEYYSNIKGINVSQIIEEQKRLLNEKIEEYNKKEYTSQALINLKVAALKEVARKYPRSLITSKVVPINPNMVDNSEIQYSKKQGYNPKTITDEYGNTWNEISITEDNLKGILLNKASSKKIPVTVVEKSTEIENITKKWLALAGIKFEEVDQVVGRNGDPIDAFGKADLLNKVVQVVRGDMGKQALPEEAAHMLVQILKENGNPLYTAMLKKVPSLPIYKQVFEDYSDVYGGDTLKIAEEAIGKIIGENLKGGNTENAWFERVWNWVKSTFKKMFGISSDLAPFMEASNIILRGENVGELIGTDAEYYKLNANPDKQAAVIKTLGELSSEVVDKTEGGLYKTKSGKVIGSRVTNLVQMYRMRAIKDSTFTQDEAYINYMAKRGTVNHLFNQAIMNDLEAGGVKSMEHYINVVKAEIEKSPEFEKGSNLYNISRESFRGLVNGVTHLHTHIKQKDPGAKIITEQVIANKDFNLAGTIDVLVVHSDGSASIYDYKTKNFKPVLDENKKVITYHGIGEFTEDLYSEQISHYKNILKDLGVNVFRETRIIPIHAPFKWDYQNSKATPSAPVDMWIPEYGKEKDYLNHLPVSGEKTDYKAANEMLEKMFLAKARIKQALKKDYDNPKAKAHLDRLNKAIKRIQLDTDITGTFEDLQAAFKTIDNDVSRQNLSISEIKDLVDYLNLYSNIASVYMETSKEIASDLTETEVKQLRIKCMSYSTAIQTRTDILNKEFIERLDQMGSEAVEIDPQTGDIKVKDAIEQGFLGSLFNGMGDISNPIFQDARKAVAVASEHRKIQFEEKRAKLTELDNKFSSAASLLGYTGINTYDLMYNEAGDGLTTKLDKKFYEDRKLAYKTKNLHWFKEYTYFDKEGFEKFKADKLAAINNPENAYTEADKKRELAYIDGLDVESDFEKIANPKNKFVKPKADIDQKEYINKKWKTIQDNADLKGLYDFWVDFIAEMKEQDSSIASNFIPKIRMSILESVGKFGIDAINIAGGKGALKNALTVRQQDSMVGAINDDGTPDFRVPLLYTDNVREPLSSKEHQDVVEAAINKYKKAFDTKLSDDAIQNTHEFNTLLKSEVEYAEIKKGKKMVSKDFSSTAMLMMDSFYNYKHMKSVEERILALKSLFAAQNTVVTDKFGRKVENPITKEWRNKLGVSTDEELFDKLTNAIIYGQRVQSKDSTVEVFGQNISMNKALGTANQYMTALSLALSPVLATSNYLGGKFNAYYTGKEGLFYTGKQLMEADKKITTHDKDTYAIIDYFQPYGRTKTSEFALGVSKASMIEKGTSTDNLLTLHNIGDDNVDRSVFVAMMDNWVIDSDGQLKSKGSKTYKLKDQNAKTVREHFSVVDGKVKTSLSVEQQAQFRSIVNKATNSIKGTVTNDSLAAINTTILGQLLMKFRTWMPGVIRTRWKDTSVDLITNEVDVGRFRVATQELFSSVPGMIKTMTQLSVEVGTFGVYKQKPNPEICKKYYEKFLSENPSVDRNEFTLDSYIEMRKQKLGALANELRMFILVGSLIASIMQSLGWDDEDESNILTYNLYRASQRTGLELGFFFSPSNVTEILKSPIPLMRVATGFGKVIDNTFDETRDRIFGENSKHDSSGLFHYTAKQIPIVNSVNSTLKNIVDLIDDDKSMEELLLGE